MGVWLLVMSAVVAATPQFEARRADGEAVAGKLAQLSAESIVLETPSGPQTLRATQVLELVPRKSPEPMAEASAWVELTDGSAIAAADFRVHDRKAEVILPGGKTLEVPGRAVANVRFNRQRGRDDKQWTDIASAKHTGDTIVVRKEDALDYLNGVLGDVTAETVDFDLDGEKVPVKRRKVEGLIYAEPKGDEIPAAFCLLRDAGGSELQAKSVEIRGDVARVVTPAGLSAELPLANLAGIEIKTQFLSDLTPESVAQVPYFGTSASQTAAARLFFGPRLNPPSETEPLRVHGTTYAKGLTLRGGSEVVFRLPGKFRTLNALAGIDDAVRPQGNVKLTILGDDRTLLEAEISGKQKEPLPIKLRLDGVKRLKIVVDYNGDEVGDQLDICEARLLP